MVINELKIVIDDFIDLIENGTCSIKQNINQLRRLLDELSTGLQIVSTTFADLKFPDPPNRNQQKLRNLVCSRFPDYGLYNIPKSVIGRIGEPGVVVGDAIDDIVDITTDLSKVAWRWEHNNSDDAIWYFYQSYVSHWGSHLRFLQLYIHLSIHGE